jgi:hypothetical protein
MTGKSKCSGKKLPRKLTRREKELKRGKNLNNK